VKRPSFQFYPGDWTGNSNLRRCSHAEKGVWLDVMCLMHDQAEYGVLRWPLSEIAQAVGCKIAELQALTRKDVLKGSDKQLAEAFVYTPRSGRKDGEPVTLVPIQDGPLWFSSRMVKDEYVRTIRGESTRFGEDEGEAPKQSRKRAPKPPFGDGSSSSSSSSPSGSKEANASSSSAKPPAIPTCPHLKLIDLFGQKLPTLAQPKAEFWDGKPADNMRARWKWLLTATRSKDQTRYATTEAEAVEWFGRFFDFVAESDFLMARSGDFKCTLQWLVVKDNFAKVVQGNYKNKDAQ
jgi:hypothetical protein